MEPTNDNTTDICEELTAAVVSAETTHVNKLIATFLIIITLLLIGTTYPLYLYTATWSQHIRRKLVLIL